MAPTVGVLRATARVGPVPATESHVELLVLEHDPATGLHRFADVLAERTSLVPLRHVDATDPDGSRFPDVAELAGVVVMGGPQSVADDATHGWLTAEQQLLRDAVGAEVPVLAVCLGAQVLATAHGGAVSRLEVPEVGYLPLSRVGPAAAGEEDVTAGWPDGAATLLLHEDAVTTLPPAAEPLLEGPAGAVAWRLGSAVATQAHPEVDAAQLERWLAMPALAELVARADVDPDELLAEAQRRERFVRPLGDALIGRFVDGPVRRRATGSRR